MAVEVGALSASLSLNASSFITGMQQANRSMQQTATAIQQQAGLIGTLTNQLNSVTGTLGKFTSGFGRLRGALTNGLALFGAYSIVPSIFQAAKSAFIDFNQQVDQASVALTNFLGSATASKKMIKELQDFAAKTPFQFKDLLGTTQSMMAMGVAADEVLPRMRAIGDAAAAMGGSPETLYRIQRALGQIQAKGRVQSEELLQLAEAGIPAYQYLAEALGTTTADMLGDLKKGTVDAHTAITAVLDGMSRDFGGMMEMQSKTMMGALSTVKDYVQIVVGAITRPLFEAFRDTFVGIAGILSTPAVTQASQNFANGLARIAEAIKSGLIVATKLATPAAKRLADSLGNLISAAMRLAKAIAPTASLIATVLVGAFIAVVSAIAPIVQGVTMLIEFLTRFQIVVQAAGAVLVAVWVRGLYQAAIANGVFGKSLAGLSPALTTLVQNFVKNFGTIRAFGGTTFSALSQSAAVSFRTIVVGAKAMGAQLMASLGPLALIAVAIYAATKIFTAFSNRNKDVKERTKELTEKIKEQTDAMGGNVAAMQIYLKGFTALDQALTASGENGDKLNKSLTYLGLTQKDATSTLVDFKKNQYDASKALALANGVTNDRAAAIATMVNSLDKMSESDFRSLQATYGLTSAELELAVALEEVADQAENFDLSKNVKTTIEAAVAADKNAVSLQKQAQAYIENQKKAGTKYTADEEAIALYKEFTRLYEQYAKRLDAEAIAAAKAGKITHDAVKALNELAGAAKDGEVDVSAFERALYGEINATLSLARTNRDTRKSLGDLLDGVKESNGNFEKLTDSAYLLKDMISKTGADILTMGGNSADVANMMKSLIEQFTSSALSAGHGKEEIDGLLKTLGVLAGYDALKVQIQVDLTQAIKAMEEFAKVMYEAGAFNMQQYEALAEKVRALKEMSSETAKFANASYDAIRDGAKGASKDVTTLKDVTKAYQEAIKDQQEAVDDAKRSLLDYAKSAAGAMRQFVSFSSVLERFSASQEKAKESREKAAEIAAQKAADALEEQKQALRQVQEEQNSYAASLGNAVVGVLSFTDVLSQQKSALDELTKAQQNQATAQEKFNGASTELEALLVRQLSLEQEINNTRGRRRRRELGEELAKVQEDAAKATENFVKAQVDLQSAIDSTNEAGTRQLTFLQGLEKQATKAREFGLKLGALAAAGLSKDAMRQIASAGADAGMTMASELLTGGADAISKANEFVAAIKKSADDLSSQFTVEIEKDKKQYEDVAEYVGESFAKSLNEQAFKAREFSANVKELISMGLSGPALEEVINAGVDAGNEIAKQLIKGGVDAIRQTMELQNALQEEADALGIYAAPYFDQAGIRMAEALLNALKERLADLPRILANATPEELQNEIDNIGKVGRPKVPNLTPVPIIPTVLPDDAVFDFSGIDFLKDFTYTPFATGGVVTKATLGLVGEKGPEAIIPLSKLGNEGASYHITVNAGIGTNGTQVGAMIVEQIKQYEKRNGTRWRS